MSDQSGGPGWWMASDGKWYPPESHPDRRLPAPPGAAPGARQPVTIPARERIEWAAFLGAVALVLGSFMTWAQAGPFKAAGTDGDGWITIVLGTAAAIMAWREKYTGTAVLAGLGLALVVWKFADLASLADDSFITVSPGAGLFVCGFGALISSSTGFVCWRQSR